MAIQRMILHVHLGLPRIVSTIDDMQWFVDTQPLAANGFTFCTGSYGVLAENDLVKMAEKFADRIYFVHLRSTQRRKIHEVFTKLITLPVM